MENLIFSINTVAPVFLIILVGIFLKKIGIIDEKFVSTSSQVVFKVSLPALIFSGISKTDFRTIFSWKVLAVMYGGIFFAFAFSWLLSVVLIQEPERKGPFIQGSLRGNTVIMGLALVMNVFGEQGVAEASIIVAFIVPLFNVLSVIALTVPMHSGGTGSYKKIVLNLVKNPLIIAILVSLPFSILSIQLPVVIDVSLSYLAKMTLPLALIGIGGSLSFSAVRSNFLLSAAASFIKIVIVPAGVVIAGIKLGIRDSTLGIIFIISAAPAAISSFVMTKAMKNDSQLAANIIVISTLGSIFTIGSGIFILKTLDLLGV